MSLHMWNVYCWNTKLPCVLLLELKPVPVEASHAFFLVKKKKIAFITVSVVIQNSSEQEMVSILTKGEQLHLIENIFFSFLFFF